jgi:NTP pyrophosphatase (non-canonical NTP hydrolase)
MLTAHSYPFTNVQPSRLDEMYAAEKAQKPMTPCQAHSFQNDLFDMGLNDYQSQTNTTAIYPKAKALEYLTTGLAGEVGELCSKVAKAYRKDAPLDKSGCASEIGDILWFLAQLADVLHYNLADIASDNLSKLRDRKDRGVLQGNGDNR